MIHRVSRPNKALNPDAQHWKLGSENFLVDDVLIQQ
jgi:hypothetical protein